MLLLKLKYSYNSLSFKFNKLSNEKRSLAYKLVFSSFDTTLTDDIIMPIFDKIINDVINKFNCELRDK